MRLQDDMILQVLSLEGLEGSRNVQWAKRKVLIYMCMKSRSTTKEIRFNVRDMAALLGMSARSAYRTMDRLEKDGLIKRTAYQLRPDRRYKINL